MIRTTRKQSKAYSNQANAEFRKRQHEMVGKPCGGVHFVRSHPIPGMMPVLKMLVPDPQSGKVVLSSRGKRAGHTNVLLLMASLTCLEAT